MSGQPEVQTRFIPSGPFYEIAGSGLKVIGTTGDKTEIALGHNQFMVPSGAVKRDPLVSVADLQIVKRMPGITYVAWKQPDGDYDIFPVPPEALELL